MIDNRTNRNSRPFVPSEESALPAGPSTVATSPTASSGGAASHNWAAMENLPSNAPVTPQKTVKDTPEDSQVETFGDAQNSAIMQLLADDSNYVTNILNDYRQPMYKFRLFMTTEKEIVTGSGDGSLKTLYETIDKLPQVTIAESGVTAGFNIQSVEMDQAVGPGFRNRSSYMTNMSIMITEPVGSSFREAILTAGMDLGIQNFAKVWYYLELSFIAYNEDGSINPAPLEPLNLPNGGRWIYQIAINNMEIHMDESESTYKLACTPYSMHAFDDDTCGRVPEGIKVGGGTIKEFCDNFAEELTQKWTDRYLGEVYKFKINIQPFEGVGDISNYKLVQSEIDPVKNLALNPKETGSGRAPEAQIPRGTTINDVILFLFCNCEETQKLILDTNSSQDAEDTGGDGANVTFNGKDYRVPIVPMVEADVRVTGYDVVSGHYMKEITYTIWGYRSYTSNICVSQYSKIQKNPEIANRIVEELRKKNYLKKKYEYMYTGMNTEVIKFDLDFNFAFCAVMPRLAGWRQGIKQVSHQEKYNTALQNNGDMKGQNTETKPDVIPLEQLQSDLQKNTSQIDDANSVLEDPVASPEKKRAAQAQLDAARRANAEIQSSVNFQRSDSLRRQQEQRERIEAQGPVNIYAEDAIGSKSSFNLTYLQGHDEPTNASGIGFGGQWHRGASLSGAIMNQLYQPVQSSSGGGVSMASINLDIKGDPYWIGYSNIERRAITRTGKPENGGIFPNYTDGDATFAMIFRFPTTLGDSGQPVIRNDDVFNGVYRVVTVRSRFDGGEFRQTLEAVKLDLITPMTSSTGGQSPATTAGSSSTNQTPTKRSSASVGGQ